MNYSRIFLSLAALLCATAGFAQYPAGQVAYGDGTSTLVSHSSLKYTTYPQLTMTSPLDNYFTMVNGSGYGHMEFDQYGNWVWWTPLNSLSKMALMNDGQLRLASSPTGIASSVAPSKYAIFTDRGALFNGEVKAQRSVVGSAITSSDGPASVNEYHLFGATSSNIYHTAQSNLFQVLTANSGSTQREVITGYQSAAQSNEAELNYQDYTDLGPGQIWSVQTNSFHPVHSNLSKYINTYVRTHLDYDNTIGTYYTMFLEAPIGPGSVSQITNYYGVYQESAAAKNFFAGKLWLGTIPTGSVNSDAQLAVTGKVWIGAVPSGTTVNSTDAQLAVNGNVYCSKLKVLQSGWADYVFAPGYKLPTLPEVEAFIKAQGHLPGVATAKEIEDNGNDLGENQKMLLQKVEELTLYMIELNKKVDALQKENEALKAHK